MQSTTDFKSGDLFQAIVDQAPDAIIFSDCDGIIRVWNQGAEAIFGYDASEIIGLNLDVIVPERFRAAHWSGFRRAIEAGQTKYNNRVLTTRSTHKNGAKLYVDMSFGLVKNDAGTVLGALAIARDCTARHLAEAARASRPEGAPGHA